MPGAAGNYEIKDHYDLAAFNRAVDNAEMRTIDGEPETTEQRDLAKRIAKAIAGTSSFTKADALDKKWQTEAVIRAHANGASDVAVARSE